MKIGAVIQRQPTKAHLCSLKLNEQRDVILSEKFNASGKIYPWNFLYRRTTAFLLVCIADICNSSSSFNSAQDDFIVLFF